MSYFNTILNRRLEARKNPLKGGEFKLLTLIVGEVETIAKRDPAKSLDDVALSVVRKLIESNKQTMALMPNVWYTATRELLEDENLLLESLLPKQLSEDEIKVIFTVDFQPPAGQNVVGAFNQYMKTNFPGQYEGKVASKVAKELGT